MTLFVGFVLLSGLLLWLITLARGPWIAKLFLILTVPAYGFVVWHSIDQWRGYPVPASPPADAALVATLVREPTDIYLWAVPPGSEEPRAYRIPYTRQSHEALAGAQQAVGAGVRVGVRVNRGRVVVYRLPLELPAKG